MTHALLTSYIMHCSTKTASVLSVALYVLYDVHDSRTVLPSTEYSSMLNLHNEGEKVRCVMQGN